MGPRGSDNRPPVGPQATWHGMTGLTLNTWHKDESVRDTEPLPYPLSMEEAMGLAILKLHSDARATRVQVELCGNPIIDLLKLNLGHASN